ncbi:MAG: hypothetical protein CMF74_16350 [Maricaulis sp.]|jgi:hypothetical protein|nr:hypothetical protein [Maricaulis sp.]HAQ35997.1 hypothetical protein [Alphaproteobacteria bacterium]
MRRRTREILTAGTIAMTAISVGMIAPATSLDRWDASSAVRAGLPQTASPQLSDNTRRTLAGLTTRQTGVMTSETRFEIASLPGNGSLVVEHARIMDVDGSHPAMRVAAPFITSVPPEDTPLTITPHAIVEPTRQGTQARLGADFSFGDGSISESGWFAFAAAERHALFVDAGRLREPTTALDLQPYSVIGSAQAGIAYRINPDMNFALAWMEREWAYRYGQTKWEADEEYVAATFVMTW